MDSMTLFVPFSRRRGSVPDNPFSTNSTNRRRAARGAIGAAILAALVLAGVFASAPQSAAREVGRRAAAERGPERLTGRVAHVERDQVTVELAETRERADVLMAPGARIILNSRPAALHQLQPGDFVRITRDADDPEFGVELVAAREAEGVRDRPVPMREPYVVERPIRRRSVDAGLGLTVAPGMVWDVDLPQFGIVNGEAGAPPEPGMQGPEPRPQDGYGGESGRQQPGQPQRPQTMQQQGQPASADVPADRQVLRQQVDSPAIALPPPFTPGQVGPSPPAPGVPPVQPTPPQFPGAPTPPFMPGAQFPLPGIMDPGLIRQMPLGGTPLADLIDMLPPDFIPPLPPFTSPFPPAAQVQLGGMGGGMPPAMLPGLRARELEAQWVQLLWMSRPEARAPVVVNVARNSPAEDAGILPGDFIVAFDGQRVYQPDDLVRMIREQEPDNVVPVQVLRGREVADLGAQLTTRSRAADKVQWIPRRGVQPRHRIPNVRGVPMPDLGMDREVIAHQMPQRQPRAGQMRRAGQMGQPQAGQMMQPQAGQPLRQQLPGGAAGAAGTGVGMLGD